MLNDDGKKGGDITAERGANPQTIMGLINKLMVKPFLRDLGLYEKDILQIIHIADTDGCYIPDECVLAEAVEKPFYTESAIRCSSPESIRDRNRRKSENLDFLSAQTQLKSNHSSINYRLYFNSCNQDHFLGGDRNMRPEEKENCAENFAYAGENTFRSTFLSDSNPVSSLSYEDSWDYLRQGTNSLNSASNLCVLINNLLNGLICSAPEKGGTAKEAQKSVAFYSRYMTKSGEIKRDTPANVKEECQKWLAEDPQNLSKVIRKLKS